MIEMFQYGCVNFTTSGYGCPKNTPFPFLPQPTTITRGILGLFQSFFKCLSLPLPLPLPLLSPRAIETSRHSYLLACHRHRYLTSTMFERGETRSYKSLKGCMGYVCRAVTSFGCDQGNKAFTSSVNLILFAFLW